MPPFNRQNPFNLNLKALSKYQQRRNDANVVRKRQNYQTLDEQWKQKLLKRMVLKGLRSKYERKILKCYFFKFSKAFREVAADVESVGRKIN